MTSRLPNPDTIDWNAPYRFGENLRVLTPILPVILSKATRDHLANMPREYRERLEREWREGEAAVPSIAEPISPEHRQRADREWADLDATSDGEG